MFMHRFYSISHAAQNLSVLGAARILKPEFPKSQWILLLAPR